MLPSLSTSWMASYTQAQSPNNSRWLDEPAKVLPSINPLIIKWNHNCLHNDTISADAVATLHLDDAANNIGRYNFNCNRFSALGSLSPPLLPANIGVDVAAAAEAAAAAAADGPVAEINARITIVNTCSLPSASFPVLINLTNAFDAVCNVLSLHESFRNDKYPKIIVITCIRVSEVPLTPICRMQLIRSSFKSSISLNTGPNNIPSAKYIISSLPSNVASLANVTATRLFIPLISSNPVAFAVSSVFNSSCIAEATALCSSPPSLPSRSPVPLVHILISELAPTTALHNAVAANSIICTCCAYVFSSRYISKTLCCRTTNSTATCAVGSLISSKYSAIIASTSKLVCITLGDALEYALRMYPNIHFNNSSSILALITLINVSIRKLNIIISSADAFTDDFNFSFSLTDVTTTVRIPRNVSIIFLLSVTISWSNATSSSSPIILPIPSVYPAINPPPTLSSLYPFIAYIVNEILPRELCDFFCTFATNPFITCSMSAFICLFTNPTAAATSSCVTLPLSLSNASIIPISAGIVSLHASPVEDLYTFISNSYNSPQTVSLIAFSYRLILALISNNSWVSSFINSCVNGTFALKTLSFSKLYSLILLNVASSLPIKKSCISLFTLFFAVLANIIIRFCCFNVISSCFLFLTLPFMPAFCLFFPSTNKSHS
ncbi:hypothetical protein AX774_g3561 [Zancudomyces culisetae]|uniref:Uncharacterized protein n=1 Tax=Zancudomyces culisetae TaxID=1213189 RepID=A0A1R1PPW1_ZANCU|nr:hypothetical protein AX774_g3561 [Zancudomyces culisetae]|eukprot:OMH82943.1 hypothetical protein AX774_g3561 [Zancudomyces culisetae]